MTIKNLELHRSGETIWDRAESGPTWDGERWLIGGAAVAFLIAGLRRRSPAGLAMVVSSGAMAWWALSKIDERRRHRGRLRAVLPMPNRPDPIRESSEESFPASDAPSWTPTTAGHTTTAR